MRKLASFLIILAVTLSACGDKTEPEPKSVGYLSISVVGGVKDLETTAFSLRVSNPTDTFVDEVISSLPDELSLPAGRYTVEVYSSHFDEPQFEMPVYSGEANVEIVAGESRNASIVCKQANAGVRVIWSNEFAAKYQTYQAVFRDAYGYLTYSAAEDRIAYFLPGTVTLNVAADGEQLSGADLTLSAGDLLYLTLNPAMETGGNLAVGFTVDMSVNERNEEITLNPAPSNSKEKPYSVAQAIARQGETDVWVSGYIAGSKAKGTSNWDFVNVASWQVSTLVITDTPSETDADKALVVELPSGRIRDALNLIDNPEMLQKQVILKGDLTTYYDHAGLKSPTDFATE